MSDAKTPKLTPAEQQLADVPLWLVRAEMEANGKFDADYLIDIVQARIKAAGLWEEYVNGETDR